MNINSPEDAKGMIDEVKAKGPEAIEKQLEKVYTDEMLAMIITGLWLTIDCIRAFDQTGNLESLMSAKKNLQTATEMMRFAQVALEEDILHANALNIHHNKTH
jgi:hypothetical protein